MDERYIKVRFTSKEHGVTAGLIFPESVYERMSVEKLSRHFPYSEALKMRMIERSKAYRTWEEAFLHSFDTKES